MTNYNNGKIYKIEALNGDDGDIYIGSTTKQYLSQRISNHRYHYKKRKMQKFNNCTSFKVFDKYGVDNCKITLLETVNVNSKDELLSRESHYIKKLNCVNKYVPNRTLKEYYEENKDEILVKKKTYYDKNVNEILEKKQIKFSCECGSICTNTHKTRHNKTKKHIEYLNSIIL